MIVFDVVVDVFVLYVVVGHDALCSGLLDGFLSFYADVVVIFRCVVVDAEVVCVVANLVGVAFLLWMPPMDHRWRQFVSLTLEKCANVLG